MVDLKHDLGAERLVTAQEITETLCGVNLCHIVTNVLLKLQEIDLALRQIPELHDTHLTSIRELMVQMYNDEHACLTAVQKPQDIINADDYVWVNPELNK